MKCLLALTQCLWPTTKHIKYNTFFGNNLRTPKHNTNIVRQTLKFMGTKVWNEIPTEIRNSHSNSIFKSYIKISISSYNSMTHLAQPQ